MIDFCRYFFKAIHFVIYQKTFAPAKHIAFVAFRGDDKLPQQLFFCNRKLGMAQRFVFYSL